jgi:hypothetical protein
MTRLMEEALDFARSHVETFYDSDFFPKSDEFEALWSNWDQVRLELTHTNVEKLSVRTPRALPAPKTGGGYRIVHQLDPVDALVYTALAYSVAPDVEAARIPPPRKAVFSYRLELSKNSFFSRGNGYDISDFYNRIYLHRHNADICYANQERESLAHDIEDFLTRLNGRASQGVPVGPAASIVMSEATMSDLDQYLESCNLPLARYVDDIRVFSDSEEELLRLEETLTEYLFDSHRLQFNWRKTKVMASDIFSEKYLDAPALIEARQLLGAVRSICSYGDLYTADDLDALRTRFLTINPNTDDRSTAISIEHQNRIGNILRYFQEQEKQEKRNVRSQAFVSIFLHGIGSFPLDLGLVRHALRQCRSFRNPVLVPLILEKLDLLGPVVPEVFLYFNAVTSSDLIDAHLDQFRGLLDSRLTRTSQLARFWAFWYLASHPEFIRDPKIGPKIWKESSVEHQARAARATNNLAWVRSQKTAIGNFGPWQKRALLLATEVMPRDERRAWLGSLSRGMDSQERSIVQWALAQ